MRLGLTQLTIIAALSVGGVACSEISTGRQDCTQTMSRAECRLEVTVVIAGAGPSYEPLSKDVLQRAKQAGSRLTRNIADLRTVKVKFRDRAKATMFIADLDDLDFVKRVGYEADVVPGAY